MVHHVKDLSPEQRRAAEVLLGRPVSDEESLSIKTIEPCSIIPSTLSADQRRTALAAFDRYFEQVDAGRLPVSVAEEEAILTEAIRSARPSYRPMD